MSDQQLLKFMMLLIVVLIAFQMRTTYAYEQIILEAIQAQKMNHPIDR